ncbi:MAG: helicase-related protein [Candidatus Hadarchaeales archaeon]
MQEGLKEFFEHPLLRPRTLWYRRYQEEIMGEAVRRNTMVILPTALGKTVISILVAVQLLHRYRKGKVLVMAPTRPLVVQHARNFVSSVRLLPSEPRVLTGRVDPGRRESAWKEGRVFFATPEVVRNDLEEGRLGLGEFVLLVFDECHRAVKEYAYTLVAQRYLQECPYPLVLGLTASPGSSPERIEAICRALGIEHVEYRTELDEDVSPYVHPVEVTWQKVPLPPEYSSLSSLLREMAGEKVRWLWEHGYLRVPPSRVTRKILLGVGEELRRRLAAAREKGPLFTALRCQSLSLTLSHALELLESQGPSALRSFLERVEGKSGERRTYSLLLRDPRYARLKELLASLPEHPKMERLLAEVRTQLESSRESRVLVFAQYRDTASRLVEHLSRGLPGVRVERFVGQSSRARDLGLKQREQLEVLDRFRRGETRVLVGTSIAEEGLDIPSVDLVVFYEPVPSEIRYIQRKGRTGRFSFGRVVILLSESRFDLASHFSSRRKVKRMQSLVREVERRLQPILRLSVPTPDPMTEEELSDPLRDAPFQVEEG